jgi:hypothetical protein
MAMPINRVSRDRRLMLDVVIVANNRMVDTYYHAATTTTTAIFRNFCFGCFLLAILD